MSTALTYLFTYIIEGLIAFYYLQYIFNKKQTRYTPFLFYTIAYGMQYIFSFFHNITINGVTFLLMNFLLVLFLYNATIFLALFHSIIMTVLMTVSELLTGNLLGSIYSNYNVADMKYTIFILYFIISKTTYFTLLTFIIRFITKKHRSQIQLDKSSFLLTAIPIFSLGIMITFYYICTKIQIPHLAEHFVIVGSICTLIINLLVVWLFEYTQKDMSSFSNCN